MWQCWWMPLSLHPDKLKELQTSLKRYLVENVDPEAGDQHEFTYWQRK